MWLHRSRIVGLGLAVSCSLAMAQAQNNAFRLEIAGAIAGNAPGNKKAVLVVRSQGCDDVRAAEIRGTAEGVVNGARQSIPLQLTPLERPGVYSVGEQWPAGRWVLNLAGTCRGKTAGALVPLNKSAFIREASKFLTHAPTAAEIEASLSALGGGTK